ncbi:MAG: acetylglutamate kinase [Acidimicrobiales bacterium]|nr:MAG: acetylglutamate kinase [Acidimicrobiales bacterium]
MSSRASGRRRLDPAERAAVLVEALPYIRRFQGVRLVVKIGGSVMDDERRLTTFADDVVLLRSVGMLPVIVHGGGPQIGDLMERLGKRPTFKDGLRVTDSETLDIARMVLVGKINRDIVGAINRHGPLAVGLSGEDAGLITAEAADAALGFVGEVEAVNPSILERLLAESLIPVVSSIGRDRDGQPYNINADTAAAALAAAIGAERIVYLSDVPGLLADPEDASSLVELIDARAARRTLSDGNVGGGMAPKLRSCLLALERGVRSAHLLDGRVPHVLLLELFTDEGAGTMVVHEDAGDGEEDICR